MSALLDRPRDAATALSYMAEDLLSRADSHRFELVNGELVERNMGWRSEWIGTNLVTLLGSCVRENRLGYVNGSNAGYQCFESVFPNDPDRTRKPDVSFISAAKMQPEEFPEGHCDIVPDLAVEVISPNDLYSDVEYKVDEYLQAGVLLVWVIDPRTESVRIHRADGSVQDVRGEEELSGESVIPGFRCAVGDLFRVPT